MCVGGGGGGGICNPKTTVWMTYRWSAVKPWHFGFEARADVSRPLNSWIILAWTRAPNLMENMVRREKGVRGRGVGQGASR